MDAFEVRMQFLTHLRRLTSAAQSINKVVSFLIKHSSHASASRRASTSTAGASAGSSSHASVKPSPQEQDMWACILEELEKSSINARMNVFYMLDSLLDQTLAIGLESYRTLVEKDLESIVNLTVPTDVKDGVLNRLSTTQVLKSWKTRRLLPVAQLDTLLEQLQKATFPVAEDGSGTTFSRNDILRRIEDDRERHKRLRERIWVLPVPSLTDLAATNKDAQGKLSTVLSTRTASNSPASPSSPAQIEPKLVSLAEYAKDRAAAQDTEQKREDAIDVEFEQAWEREVASCPDGSNLNDEDWKAMEAENLRAAE